MCVWWRECIHIFIVDSRQADRFRVRVYERESVCVYVCMYVCVCVCYHARSEHCYNDQQGLLSAPSYLMPSLFWKRGLVKQLVNSLILWTHTIYAENQYQLNEPVNSVSTAINSAPSIAFFTKGKASSKSGKSEVMSISENNDKSRAAWSHTWSGDVHSTK